MLRCRHSGQSTTGRDTHPVNIRQCGSLTTWSLSQLWCNTKDHLSAMILYSRVVDMLVVTQRQVPMIQTQGRFCRQDHQQPRHLTEYRAQQRFVDQIIGNLAIPYFSRVEDLRDAKNSDTKKSIQVPKFMQQAVTCTSSCEHDRSGEACSHQQRCVRVPQRYVEQIIVTLAFQLVVQLVVKIVEWRRSQSSRTNASRDTLAITRDAPTARHEHDQSECMPLDRATGST